MKTLMKFLLLIIPLSAPVLTWGQDLHFIYIQSESKSPFYIRFNNKMINSSSSGYLIISKLSQGEHRLRVGFPDEQWPEQEVNLQVETKDEGLILKNFPETGWGLQNMRNANVTMHHQVAVEARPVRELKNDAFSIMLASVVNDSTILEKDPETETKEIVQTTVPITDPTTSKSEQESNDQAKTVTNDPPATSAATGIQKKSETTLDDGVEIVYVAPSENGVDTIQVIIPKSAENKSTANRKNKKDKRKAAKNIPTTEDKNQPTDEAITSNPEVSSPVVAIDTSNREAARSSNDIKITETTVQTSETGSTEKLSRKERKRKKKEEAAALKAAAEQQPVSPDTVVLAPLKEPLINKPDTAVVLITNSPVMINSDCKKLANDEDYLKLRKKIAALDDNDQMVEISKKTFKTRCFTTQQIKRLSVLFSSDLGRYLFFEAAYPFLYDTDNIKSLESQLSDKNYLERFRKLIRK